MVAASSLAIPEYLTLQLGAGATGGIQEVGNVFQIYSGGAISGIYYRSGGQANDPASLDFNLYRGTTLVTTATGTSMTGANTTHLVPLGPVTTVVGEVYTVTVKIPTGKVLYYLTGSSIPLDALGGVLYIQGRDQTVFQYGYPDEVSGHFFDVGVDHSTDAPAQLGTASAQLTTLTAAVGTIDACCTALAADLASILAAVRKTY